MPISARQFVGSTLALLLIGFAALCAILGTNIWLGERARIYARQVIEARDTKAVTVDLRAALQTAESSQRGYLYTGNEIYLAPHDLAKDRALKATARIPPLFPLMREWRPVSHAFSPLSQPKSPRWTSS